MPPDTDERTQEEIRGLRNDFKEHQRSLSKQLTEIFSALNDLKNGITRLNEWRDSVDRRLTIHDERIQCHSDQIGEHHSQIGLLKEKARNLEGQHKDLGQQQEKTENRLWEQAKEIAPWATMGMFLLKELFESVFK